MKKRIVIWATNPQNEKVLLAFNLEPSTKEVEIYAFNEAILTETFVNSLHQEWREGAEVAFPEGYVTFKNELTASGSLLPDGYTVEREDILKRAQTEWQFTVLSAKMLETYNAELDEIKNRINSATKYSNVLWDDLKNFWEKVQQQFIDRNLIREHTMAIKEHTNELFAQLKDMRKDLDKEFNELSAKHMNEFFVKLEEIEQKIEKGLSLQPLFGDLKELQNKYKITEFVRDHRNKVWNRIDAAFKKIREKRGEKSGEEVGGENGGDRLGKRYEGLIEAIDRMQKSIDRDKSDLNFQNSKISGSGGQLESQLRQARIMMIEERMRSKEVKLSDMLKTKEQLERKLEKSKERESQRADKQKIDDARKAAQDKIAHDIKEAQESRKDMEADLEKAASLLKSEKTPYVANAAVPAVVATEIIAETTAPATETVDPVEPVQEASEEIAEPSAEAVEAPVEAEAPVEEKEESFIDKIEDAIVDAVDATLEVAEDVIHKIKEVYHNLTEDGDNDTKAPESDEVAGEAISVEENADTVKEEENTEDDKPV